MTTMGHLSVWRWKDVPLTRCLFPLVFFFFFCNFDFFFLWFLSFIYLSQRALLYILSYVIDESKCGVSFPSLTGSLLLRGGSSVPRCLRCNLSTHLFPLACPSCCHTVTGKNMSLLYNTCVFLVGGGACDLFVELPQISVTSSLFLLKHCPNFNIGKLILFCSKIPHSFIHVFWECMNEFL